MPLFNPKTIQAAFATDRPIATDGERAAAIRWAALARVDFHGQNESQIEPEFNAILMQAVLGYQPVSPDIPGTIKAKQPIGAGIVDLALGDFGPGRTAVCTG